MGVTDQFTKLLVLQNNLLQIKIKIKIKIQEILEIAKDLKKNPKFEPLRAALELLRSALPLLLCRGIYKRKLKG